MKKILNRKKTIIVTLLIIFVVLIATLGTIYEKNSRFRDILDKYIFLKEKHENDLPQIPINTGEAGLNAYAFNGKILILENNELIIYNQNGVKEDEIDVHISNPIFKSCGDYLCIAEKGGKKVCVISNKNLLWQKDLEGEISDIEINQNGYVAVLLSGTIYKTIIQTFDNKGVELFKTYLSSTYVIDMEFSPDNKYLAIAEVNLSRNIDTIKY